MSERLMETSIIQPTVDFQQADQSPSFVVAEPELPTYEPPSQFPKMTQHNYENHLHLHKAISFSIFQYTKERITSDKYFEILYNYIQDKKPNKNGVSLFQNMDIDTYAIYALTAEPNRRRNSIRDPWEAEETGHHKQGWASEIRSLGLEPFEKPYHELQDQTIYRDHM